jgi:multiple sugar transport system substrate-binding protein
MNRRDVIGHATAAVWGAALPLASARAQDRYSPYRGIKLSISIPLHPHYDAMLKLLPSFTEQTGIRVEADRQSVPRMKQLQLESMVKPNSDYDLVSYVVMWKGEYVKKGLILELAPMLANPALIDPQFDVDDISPLYLENIGLVGGWRGYLQGEGAKLYGLPYGAETSILAYRSDVFDKHGFKPPVTYFELEHLLGSLREKAGMGALCTRSQAGHQCVHAWLLHLNPMGGKVFDVRWRPRFNDRAGVRALNFLKYVVETGPKGGHVFGQAEMMQSFLGGEAVMYLDSTVIMGAVRDPVKSNVQGKVAYARHPKATKYASQSGGFGLAIPTRARHPEAAFLLMQWLTSKEQDKAVCRMGGTPLRMSTLNDEAMLRQFPEYLILRSQLRDVDPDWRPIIPEWDEINTKALGVAIGEAIQGKKPSQQALDGVVAQIQDIMQRGGYIKG